MLPARGRPGTVLLMSVERELTRQDLLRAATSVASRPKVGAPMLQKLRPTHHHAARLIASGMALAEVAARVGRTAQRLGDMQRQDPAFQELISYYSSQIEELAVDDALEYRSRLTMIGLEALDELQTRFDDDTARQKMSIGELRQVAEMAGDRTVAPPKTAVPAATVPTKITFNIGTRDIQPKGADEPKVIDHESDPEPESGR